MPKKPAKYGLKLQCLCDAKTNYTCNMEVYAGKQPDGPFQLSNKPHDVTMRLTAPSLVPASDCTMRLTAPSLVKKNKPDIPPEMRPQKDREVFTSKFGFRKDMMMASYVPKQKKTVIMLSTMHSNASIDETTRDKQKPSVVSFYNSTKGGVDTADKKCAATSCSRRTNRWPMSLLYSLINKVCLNSFVIYVRHNETNGLRSRREF